MADVTFTATALLKTSTSVILNGYAGEAVARGKAVYQYSSDNEFYVADCTNAAKDAAIGIAMNDAGNGQPLAVHMGGDLTCDGLTAGTNYVLSTTGGICPVADLNLTTDYCTYIGSASSATNLKMPTSGPVVTGYKTP